MNYRKVGVKTDAVKDKAGMTLTESDADEEQMEEIMYESMEPAPLRSEVELALNHFSNGKSPGIDNILIEMWKASGKEGIRLLWKLYKMVLEMKKLLQDW